MSYYVRLADVVIGRGDYYQLAKWVLDSGVGEVHIHTGGWSDRETETLYPHIKFDTKEDATAYILANGGVYSTEAPIRK
jgi:hypothetical protein